MYVKPFKYVQETQRIEDANGIEVCMMRGWAELSKLLNPNTACEVQDHMGEMINHLLNENFGKSSNYCQCKFAMIMRNEQTQKGYCAQCEKEVEE